MGNKTNSVASIGVTNLTTMAISKGVTFVGAVLMFIAWLFAQSRRSPSLRAIPIHAAPEASFTSFLIFQEYQSP